MKSLVHLLRSRVRWAITHDDDGVGGVYAIPGPRAQGDEAASEPVLSASLLDDFGTVHESASRDEAKSTDDEPEAPPDEELN